MNIFDTNSTVFQAFELAILGDKELRHFVSNMSEGDLQECLSVDCVKGHSAGDREDSLERLHKFVTEEVDRRNMIAMIKKYVAEGKDPSELIG